MKRTMANTRLRLWGYSTTVWQSSDLRCLAYGQGQVRHDKFSLQLSHEFTDPRTVLILSVFILMVLSLYW